MKSFVRTQRVLCSADSSSFLKCLHNMNTKYSELFRGVGGGSRSRSIRSRQRQRQIELAFMVIICKTFSTLWLDGWECNDSPAGFSESAAIQDLHTHPCLSRNNNNEIGSVQALELFNLIKLLLDCRWCTCPILRDIFRCHRYGTVDIPRPPTLKGPAIITRPPTVVVAV